ncbi:MAG TPA: WG repeat-containing protein [Saprospiraceae bacterium]|nr:WG repeat-containing protein [Saprospiraceae bacterium]HMP23645.1 WG repeat-containing protein [Saprospiraceae bacterium]
MKNCTLALLVALLLLSAACRQSDNKAPATTDDTVELSLIPYRDGDLWGFAKPNGSVVVRPQYESAYLLDDGYGRFYSGDKTGIISPEGKVLLETTDYMYIGAFENGLASFVTKAGRNGYLNAQGEVVIAPVYDEAYPFQRDFAIVRKGSEYLLIRPDGSLIQSVGERIPIQMESFLMSDVERLQADPDFIIVQQPKTYLNGLIDKKGTTLIEPIYESLSQPVGGILVAQMANKSGLIRTDGSAITPREFDYIYRVGADRFIVQKGGDKSGVIDEKGKVVIPIEYSSLIEGPNDTYLAYRNESAGLIDKNGQIVLPFEYSVLNNRLDYFVATNRDMRTGVINRRNEVLLSFEYDMVEILQADRFLVEKNGKRGIVNARQQALLPIEYDVTYLGGDSHEYMEGLDRPHHCLLLYKDGQGTLFNVDGKPLSDKKWLYCGYPDRFGLVVATDANGRENYIGPDGRIYAKDAPLKKVTVSNVQALSQAIGNDTEITLEDGQYDLGAVTDTTKFVSIFGFEGAPDRSIIIHDVRNLHIKARNAGKAQLITPHAFVPVLSIENSYNISLTGLSVGHEVAPGLCEGAVLTTRSVQYLLVDNCDLYGSGTLGLEAYDTGSLMLHNTVVRECTAGILALENCYNALVDNCTLRDNEGDHMVKMMNSWKITFRKTQFTNNQTPTEYGPYEFFKLQADYERVALQDCTFTNCTADYFATFSNSLEETNVNRKGLQVTQSLWRQVVQ